MILQCPRCVTRYQLPDQAFASGARLVRCVRCEYSWHTDGKVEAAANDMSPSFAPPADFTSQLDYPPLPQQDSVYPPSSSTSMPNMGGFPVGAGDPFVGGGVGDSFSGNFDAVPPTIPAGDMRASYTMPRKSKFSFRRAFWGFISFLIAVAIVVGFGFFLTIAGCRQKLQPLPWLTPVCTATNNMLMPYLGNLLTPRVEVQKPKPEPEVQGAAQPAPPMQVQIAPQPAPPAPQPVIPVAGQKFKFASVHSEAVKNPNGNSLAITAQIINTTNKMQNMSDIRVLLLDASGQTIKKWQIQAPTDIVLPGAVFPLHIVHKLTVDIPANIQLSFIEDDFHASSK